MTRQSPQGNILSESGVFTKIAHPFKIERSNAMQKIKTTLTILIFILICIAGLSLAADYYSSAAPHLSQQQNLIVVLGLIRAG
jgi:hypothetical protein